MPEQNLTNIDDIIRLLITFGIPVFLILLGLVAGRIAEARHFRSLDSREAEFAGMSVTDLRSCLRGAEASKHAELVTTEVVIANDYLKSFFASLRKIVGGELKSYQSLMVRGRREAILRLMEKARDLGHDALCNVRYENADIGGMTRKKGAAMVAVTASATAYTARARPAS